MNDETARELTKQLKRLNFWVTMFGSLFLVAIATVGLLLVQVFLFMKTTTEKVQAVQQTVDVKTKVCNGEDSVSRFIQKNTEVCR